MNPDQVTPADLDRLQILLGELEEQWRRQRAPIAQVLAPGLPADQAQQIADGIGLRLPVEIQAWFAWHNGALPNDPQFAAEQQVGPGWLYMPLERVIDHYRSWRVAAEQAVMGDSPSVDDYWSPSWLPISEADSSALAVDCDVPEGAATPVRVVKWEFSDFREPRVASFTEAVAVWVEMLQRDLWTYDHEHRRWTKEVGHNIDLRLRLTDLA